MERDDPNGNAGDWWTQNAPPPAQTSILDQGVPPPWITGPGPIAPGKKWSDIGPQRDPQGHLWAWNPTTNAWEQQAEAPPPTKPTDPPPPNTPPPTTPPIGLPTTGFGAAPPPYASDPNPPVYDPMPTYVPPAWTGGDYVAPTEEELLASPGYGARMDAVLRARNRSAAAQGTVLNGGTLVALGRDAQTFASNEYQTLNANKLEAYKQRYAQFSDEAGRDLASRTVNANENQNTFLNRTNTYLQGNTRTLSDYITNVTNKRNAELDYWSRLRDLNQTGSGLAAGSR